LSFSEVVFRGTGGLARRLSDHPHRQIQRRSRRLNSAVT